MIYYFHSIDRSIASSKSGLIFFLVHRLLFPNRILVILVRACLCNDWLNQLLFHTHNTKQTQNVIAAKRESTLNVTHSKYDLLLAISFSVVILDKAKNQNSVIVLPFNERIIIISSFLGRGFFWMGYLLRDVLLVVIYSICSVVELIFALN